jgi:hypothetical protein
VRMHQQQDDIVNIQPKTTYGTMISGLSWINLSSLKFWSCRTFEYCSIVAIVSNSLHCHWFCNLRFNLVLLCYSHSLVFIIE